MYNRFSRHSRSYFSSRRSSALGLFVLFTAFFTSLFSLLTPFTPAALAEGEAFTISESGGSTSVGENGSTDTFTVVLDVQPSTDVVFSVSSADENEATAAPSTLTFTSGNWDTPQTVTVSGVDDSIIDGSQTTAVSIAVVDAISDDAYDGVADQTVSVSTTANDTAGFTVAESGGSTTVAETGSTDTFTVVLDAQPSSDVVISVVSSDTGEATVSPATLTFTNGNWDTPQTITITGAAVSYTHLTLPTNREV